MSTDDYAKELVLKNRRRVTLRLLKSDDYTALLAFFRELPDVDQLFLHRDVTDPELIRKWTAHLDLNRVIPLEVEDQGKIVADGTLHVSPHRWMRHVGQIRFAILPSHRHLGLGTCVARELVHWAEEKDLEKLYANVIEDDSASVAMLRRLGFNVATVLKDLVKDNAGKRRNLAIMMNDVADLGRILEDWIEDSIIGGYRVPDGWE